MKGKFKLLGHIGLALFLVSVMVLALAPVAQAATAVTEVWVDFPYSDAPNTYSSTSNTYIVHFKATTALVRGVDTVTVTFPDGSTAMGGDGDTGGNYVFTVSSTAPSASTIDFSTNYDTSDLVTGATWTDCTATPTVGGKRVQVKTPIDITAGQDVWVRYVCGSAITAAATEASTYKVYLSTSKDTTPVLSSAFALGDSTSVAGSTAMVSGYPLPATAGSTATYILTFVPADGTTLTASTAKVTIKFPLQATVPSSLSVTDVSFSAAGTTYTNTPETPTVNANTKEVTAITPLTMTGDGSADWYIKIAGITNPTIADSSSYKYMVRTSGDGKYECTDADPITAGSITKVIVADGEIGTPTSLYSDDATMVDMYSSQIYIAVGDQYGNAKAPDSEVTVSLTSSSSTGSFYWCDTKTSMTDTVTSCTTVSVGLQDPNASSDGDQIVYYKDSTAGTHTLTFSATGYTSATRTFTVCPGVSVYDSTDNLVSTYKPLSTSPTAETGDGDPYTQKYAVDYINDAVNAAMTGDTLKLGDGIYELDASISLNEAVTLTSVNGAAYTTLRPTTDAVRAIDLGGDGTATNPLIVDGFTFDRLRPDTEFHAGVMNNGYDYVTVRNNIFNYIIPDQNTSHEAIIWTRSYTDSITSSTVSDNTFNNCCGFNAISGRAATIVFDLDSCGDNTMTGVTISGNTLTDCNDYGIQIRGNNSTAVKPTVVITNNTITNGYSSLNLSDYIESATITGNTITGGYNYGITVEGTNNTAVTIKNNTITGCPTYGIKIDDTDDVVTIQYNHISGNGLYGIYQASLASSTESQNCKYNWWGDASGPTYTALTGATITKSNPDGTGDVITDDVLYYPWLHKPLADVVADNASYQTSTMKLVSGWNTMSTPAKLISTADSIDELIPSGMTIGYYYDGGWQQITTGYVLDPCDAVYVKMSAATYVQFKIDAGAFSTPSKDLVAGWNLVGLSDLTVGGMDADDAMVSVYKSAGNLPGYSQIISPSQNAAQTDIYYAAGGDWTVTMAEHGDDTSNMLPGLGYWCYMQNPATLAGFVITPIVPDLD